jgi:cytochrome c biogenesis protein CcmG, thiol:disulfide interchange protein DsbE
MKKSAFLFVLLFAFVSISKAQMYFEFTLPDIDGNDVSMSKILEKSNVVMLSFWATWCTPCKEEMKKMADIYDKYKDKGFTYVALNNDNQKSVSKVKSFIMAQGYTFPVLMDTDKKVFEGYSGKDEMPYSLLINKKKEIIAVHTGFKTGDEKMIEEEIKAALELK